MRRRRVVLGVAGGLLIGFGAFRLLTQIPFGSVLWLLAWMIAAVVVHDGILAPATVGVGRLLLRVPVRARRYLQGALLTGALITLIAVPLIVRRGSQPVVKAILQRNYAAGLGLLLGLVAAAAVIAYLVRVLRDRVSRRPSAEE